MAKRIEKRDIVNGNILEDLNKYLDESKSKFGSLELAIKALQEAIKSLKSDAGRLKKEIGGIDVSSVKGIKELNEKRAESNKLMLDAAKLQQQETKLLIDKERLTQSQLRTQKALNAEKGKTLTVYQQESKRLNELRNNYKNLAVQNKENTREGRNMLREITALDKKLKDIDNRVGQNQRSVGKYTDAWKGLKGVLGQVGLAFGVGAVFTKFGTVLREFDEGAADVAKTTGLTTEKARELSKELLKFDTRTTISELQGLAAAAGSLNVEGNQNILDFVESADKAFVALGDDLGGTSQEIATNVGKIAGVFGDEKKFGIGEAINKIGSSINELAGKSKAAAAPILDFTQRIAGLGNLVSSADATALGAFFDEGGQSVEVAASTLNTLLPKMAQNYKDFAKTAGMSAEEFKKLAEESPIEALKAVARGAKNSEKGLFNLSKTVESFGVDSARATSIVGFLANNTERLTELQKVSNKAYQDGTSLTDEFNKKNQTLGANWEKLTNRLNAYIIGADSATGATGKISSIVGFLAENIGTIIPLVLKSALAFGTYKATLVAVNLVQSATDKGLKGIIKGFFDFKKNAEGAGGAAGKLGGALKGIGWTAIIALATELAMEFYNIASGAQLAEQRAEQFNKSMAKGTDQGVKIVGKYTAALKKQMQAIDLMDVSEEKRTKLRKQATEDTRKQIEQRIKFYEKEHAKTEELRLQVQKNRDKVKSENLSIGEFGLSPEASANIAYAQSLVTSITAREKRQTAILKELRAEIISLGDETHSLTVEEIQNTKGTLKNADAKKEQKKAYREAGDEIERVLGLIQEEQDLLNEINSSEFDKQFNSEIEAQQKNINDNQEVNLETLKRIKEEEEAYQKALAKRDYVKDIENAKSEQEVLNANLKYQIRLTEIEEKAVERQKQINDLIGEQNQALEDKADKTKEVAETVKKSYDDERTYIELTTKYLEDNIDKRIALLDKEIEAHQKQQDALQELAQNGNINAQQSIAEEARLQREAEAEKAKLEKRKQYLQIVSTFLQSYSNKLEAGKDGTQALTEALAEKTTLEALINALPSFYEGTEDTGRVANPLDSNGGRLSILHDNERVLTAEQNKQLNGLSNSDVVRLVQQGQLAETFSGGWENVGMMAELNGLGKKIDELTDVIRNKPETDYKVEDTIRGVMHLIKTTKKGNSTVVNKYRYD